MTENPVNDSIEKKASLLCKIKARNVVTCHMKNDILKENADISNEKPIEGVLDKDKKERGSHNGFKKIQKGMNSDLAKCVIVLVAIATIAGVLLGVVNWLTYVDPDIAVMQIAADAFGVPVDGVIKRADMVLNRDGSKSVVNSAFAVKYGDKTGYAYYVTGSGAYSGTVEFVIIVKDGKIDGMQVYSQSETASIGGKVLKENNLSAYNNSLLSGITDYGDASNQEASQSDIYISGATRTSKSVLNAVRAVAYAYNGFFGEGGEE